ncbi:hypothetical protein BC835DRAFT_376877 [Cytidiella melzeri]|nr:hypothetical protein BC835DRAFT_376877 [Cytidiella melzeri]
MWPSMCLVVLTAIVTSTLHTVAVSAIPHNRMESPNLSFSSKFPSMRRQSTGAGSFVHVFDQIDVAKRMEPKPKGNMWPEYIRNKYNIVQQFARNPQEERVLRQQVIKMDREYNGRLPLFATEAHKAMWDIMLYLDDRELWNPTLSTPIRPKL